MAARIIDGKKMAEQIRAEIKKKTAELTKRGKTPGLGVILVGDDPASHIYVRMKERACVEAGMYSRVLRLPEETTQEEVCAIIREWNADSRLHGILAQLPLPEHINELEVLREIDPKKDVDGLSALNAGALLLGEPGFISCTPKGIIKLIKSTGSDITGKKAVVIGRSNIVGKPVALLLLRENATVTVCHSKTVGLAEICAGADILVSETGKPELVRGNMIKPGAIVIDVGTSKVDGKLVGDVAFDKAAEIAGWITPVPGGVGPMTIAMLLENTLEACELYGV